MPRKKETEGRVRLKLPLKAGTIDGGRFQKQWETVGCEYRVQRVREGQIVM